MNFQTIIFFLREFLFPYNCGGCEDKLVDVQDSLYGLCEICRFEFICALENKNRCRICGKPLITEKETCLSCRKKNSDSYNEWIEKLQILFPYTGIFRTVLGSYKFKKSIGIGNFFTFCLKGSLENFCFENLISFENAALVPVPPRPGKFKKQGWDQIEFLAKLLEKEYKRQLKIKHRIQESPLLHVSRCLKRLPSRSQKELNREERGNNLKGRILCTKNPPRTAILFDDVITTGATLNACAAALLQGGAEKVYAVCLFYD